MFSWPATRGRILWCQTWWGCIEAACWIQGLAAASAASIFRHAEIYLHYMSKAILKAEWLNAFAVEFCTVIVMHVLFREVYRSVIHVPSMLFEQRTIMGFQITDHIFKDFFFFTLWICMHCFNAFSRPSGWNSGAECFEVWGMFACRPGNETAAGMVNRLKVNCPCLSLGFFSLSLSPHCLFLVVVLYH